MRFSKIKRYFPKAHIEIAFGNAASNVEYIQKSGKWADSAKAETSVAGSFESWGEIPVQKGMRPDMAELSKEITKGMKIVYVKHMDEVVREAFVS